MSRAPASLPTQRPEVQLKQLVLLHHPPPAEAP